MKSNKLISICGYMYHLHRRNFKIYFKPAEIPFSDALCLNSVHWLGHATTVINLNNKIIVTDPVIRKNIGQMKRLVKTSLDLTKVHIDYILISHGHMDHLDVKSLKKLNKDAIVITPPQYKRIIKWAGFTKIITLNHNEVFEDEYIKINALEAKHDGNRYNYGKFSPSNAYLISSEDKKVFFPGDTAYTERFNSIDADVALMPVGCYMPLEFQEMHCSPTQAYQMFKMSKCKTMIPIHYKTFILAQDIDMHTTQTLESFNDPDVKIVEVGQTFKF